MANGKDRTPNFKFILPRFDQVTWQDDFYNNMRAIDGVLQRFFNIANYVGEWQNATTYEVGDRVLDSGQALIYEVNVQHTTDPAPETFNEFRQANPTYYTVFTTEVQFRGEWEAQTDYASGDFVKYTPDNDTNKFAIATTAHQSGDNFNTDVDNGLWDILLSAAGLENEEIASLESLSTTGLIARIGTGNHITRTITTPNDGLSTAQGDGVSGDPSITLANDLAAVEGLSSTGIAVRIGTDNWTVRDIVAGDGLNISDGDGIAGNPTLSVTADVLRDADLEDNGGTILEDNARASNGGVLAETNNANTFTAGQVFTGTFHHDNTGATRVAQGTTAQRPTGQQGMIRWNETDGQYEGFDSAAGTWTPLGSDDFADVTIDNQWEATQSPNADNTYDLGSSGARWAQVWGVSVRSNSVQSDNDIKTPTLSDLSGTGPVNLVGQEAAKFYIRHNSTPASIDSFNLTGITDNGAGDYTFNFANNFASSSDITALVSPEIGSVTAEEDTKITGYTASSVDVGYSQGTSAVNIAGTSFALGTLA